MKPTRIRHLREKAGLTQAELAERAGISSHYMGNIERGDYEPAEETMERVKEALAGEVSSSGREVIRV